MKVALPSFQLPLPYFMFAFHNLLMVILIRQVRQWIQNFRGLMQEFIAKIPNKDFFKEILV